MSTFGRNVLGLICAVIAMAQAVFADTLQRDDIAPLIVPPFELGNAVQSGVVDIANNTTAYYPNLLPTGDALHLAENTIQEQRENGCYELVDRIHQEQMNVKYLGHGGDGQGRGKRRKKGEFTHRVHLQALSELKMRPGPPFR